MEIQENILLQNPGEDNIETSNPKVLQEAKTVPLMDPVHIKLYIILKSRIKHNITKLCYNRTLELICW